MKNKFENENNNSIQFNEVLDTLLGTQGMDIYLPEDFIKVYEEEVELQLEINGTTYSNSTYFNYSTREALMDENHKDYHEAVVKVLQGSKNILHQYVTDLVNSIEMVHNFTKHNLSLVEAFPTLDDVDEYQELLNH